MAETNIQLEKTLMVDGQTYDINAVQADKVANPLTIYKSNLNKKATKLVEFDGGAAKSIDIVPASGGSFAGRITVPPVSDATLKSDGDTVLNYNDIVNKVVDNLLNTSAMATWEGNQLSFTDPNKASVYGICVIKGLEEYLVEFASTNKLNYENATSENPPKLEPRWIPNYLYICTDTGNIYLGSCNTTDVTALAKDKNLQIEPTSVDIGGNRWILAEPNENPLNYGKYEKYGINMHNSDIINVNGLWFNDKADIRGEGIMFARSGVPNGAGAAIGYTYCDRLCAEDGILKFYTNESIDTTQEINSDRNDYTVFHSGSIIQIENGGTGKTKLEDVTVGKATQLENSRTIQTDLSSTNSSFFDGTKNIKPGITGTLQPDNGGTGKTKLEDVTVGKASKLDATYVYKNSESGNKTTETKSSKITISYEAPSGGSNGDIWIKY